MSFLARQLVKNIINSLGAMLPPRPSMQFLGITSSAITDSAALNATIVNLSSLAGGPLSYGVDTYTLHRWLCNDASGATTLADTGTGGTGGTGLSALTIQNSAQVNTGDTFLYCDTTNFTQNGATGGYAKGAANTGAPTSTTLLSFSCWIRPRSFTNSTQYILTRGYNATFVTPFSAFGIYLFGTTGEVKVEWTDSSAANHTIVVGTSTATARGYILLNQWQHIAVTVSISGGTATFAYYWNGNLIATATQASSAIGWNGASSGSWYVGGLVAAGGNWTFDGWIADARVDDGIARSAAYWKALYQAGTDTHS
jgi:hypothetical protein